MALPQGAALGATTDPKQLIHGEPAVVESVATYLDGEARGATSRLSDFDSATVRDWTGEAHEAYTYARVAQKKKLEQYADSCKRAAQSFSSFHGALTTAQASAAKAIAKWQEGEQASKAAVDAYNSKVDAYNARVKAQQADPIGRAIAFVPPGPFEDPGQALRDEAEEILDKARKKLDLAGFRVMMDGAAGSASVAEDHRGASGKANKFKVDGDHLTLFDAKGEAHEYKVDGKFSKQVGDVKMSADGSLVMHSISGEVIGKIDREGLHVGAEGHWREVGVDGNLSFESGHLKVTDHSYAYAGGDASIGFDIGKSGASAGVDAFSGGKVGTEAGFSYGGIGVGFEGSLSYGEGITYKEESSWKDGVFKFSPKVGVTDGVGASGKPTLVLDFPEMYKTGKDWVEDPGSAARDLGKGMDALTFDPVEQARVAKWAVEHPEDAGRDIGHLALELPKTQTRVADWAVHHPDDVAKVTKVASDEVNRLTNPVVAATHYGKLGWDALKWAEHHPDDVDRMTVDPQEALHSAKSVLHAIGGLFG